MTNKPLTNKPLTAAELLAKLRRNSSFVSREKRRQEENRRVEEDSQKEQKELLTELSNVGLHVKSVWDLVNTEKDYQDAIPVLVRHLCMPYSTRVKEGIVRALAVDYAGSKALGELIKEFQVQNDDSETSLKWVLGNAIATVAKPSDADTLISLAADTSQGKARDMIISALPRVVRDKVKLDAVLRRLMNDEDVRESAYRTMLEKER
jgi:hypothetical protein